MASGEVSQAHEPARLFQLPLLVQLFPPRVPAMNDAMISSSRVFCTCPGFCHGRPKTTNPKSENNEFSESQLLEVSGYLEETLAEYMSNGNPEECCQKLGNMLSDGFHNKFSEAFESRFWLHPLQFVSLKAYIALSSAYRIQASNFDYTDLRFSEVSKSFKMARSSAACSLLVAGASLHLFMFETSIMLNTAVLWIDAGESFLYLLRIARYLGKLLEPGFSLEFVSSHFTVVKDQCKSTEDLLVVSAHFIDSVSHIMINLWPFLSHGHSYLECIKNPVNFSWLNMTNRNGRQEFSGRKCREWEYTVEWSDMHQLAVCSLMYEWEKHSEVSLHTLFYPFTFYGGDAARHLMVINSKFEWAKTVMCEIMTLHFVFHQARILEDFSINYCKLTEAVFIREIINLILFRPLSQLSKDRAIILLWCKGFLKAKRGLLTSVGYRGNGDALYFFGSPQPLQHFSFPKPLQKYPDPPPFALVAAKSRVNRLRRALAISLERMP
ncbi:hypothetical protein KSP40_PGU011636 [Platanthera guangdongensis]|uniref:Uncharacterized protein n=1 Tax=Platanthera guangdongensis TaxID=2320717 RepID=A0ABR2MSD6_9ASPA